MIVGDLFFNQSQPWGDLVQEYVDHIVAAARTTVELILAHSADASTAESLLREIINPAFEGCVKKGTSEGSGSSAATSMWAPDHI